MISHTLAAVLFTPNKPLVIMDVAIPPLKPGQVLVDISFSGVCHSQLLEIRGKRGEDRFLPHTLGHEGSGIVRDVGPEVTKVRTGDHVVLSWIKGSGRDVPSTLYESEKGPINSGAISTFMQTTVVSENRITPISKKIPLKEAALLGCAIPTGSGIILNSIEFHPGNTIAIFGVGGIGMSSILAANLMHASKIIAIDILDKKLQTAMDLGATHLINSKKENVVTQIQKITGGIGVDYAVEAVGKTETMEIAFKSVRDKGGICVLAGNLPHGEKILLDPFDFIKGKKIIGTWGGETYPDRDIPLYVELYLAGKLDLKKLITHDFDLGQINDAFNELEKGNVGRALINMNTSN